MLAALQTVLARPADTATREPVELERVWFDLADAGPDAHQGWTRMTSYAGLLEAARPRREITLDWLSATAFRRGHGRASMPDPVLCLTSYLRRWNGFAEPELRLPEAALAAYASERVTVAEVALQERRVNLGGFRAVGHVGRVTWRCRAGSEELLRQVNALADYAFFCGTGIKTALGMGQTVRGDEG